MECARKNIELAGGQIAAHFKVMDILRENRTLRPRQITFLDDDGVKLSIILAEKIAMKVDELRGKQS